ncbi:MAG: DUF5683 domain-containing protein [Paludibacteraceae bacterium]|nr:DUF5683 domain-containing protein [Paludibacteraceae bacterium]
MIPFLLFSYATGYAQQVQTKENVDSTQVTKSTQDPVPVKKSTQDSVKVVKLFKPNPHKAMLMSAVIPGLGQIYNRSYWKAPIVWAGCAALVYAISWNGHYYNKYKKAYVSIADADGSTNDYLQYIPVGKTDANVDKTWLTGVLNDKQLYYRRYRDLSIIGLVGFYSLTILDAYVDAQLYDFDISPNLSLHMEPVLQNATNNTGATIGLRCQLTF